MPRCPSIFLSFSPHPGGATVSLEPCSKNSFENLAEGEVAFSARMSRTLPGSTCIPKQHTPPIATSSWVSAVKRAMSAPWPTPPSMSFSGSCRFSRSSRLISCATNAQLSSISPSAWSSSSLSFSSSDPPDPPLLDLAAVVSKRKSPHHQLGSSSVPTVLGADGMTTLTCSNTSSLLKDRLKSERYSSGIWPKSCSHTKVAFSSPADSHSTMCRPSRVFLICVSGMFCANRDSSSSLLLMALFFSSAALACRPASSSWMVGTASNGLAIRPFSVKNFIADVISVRGNSRVWMASFLLSMSLAKDSRFSTILVWFLPDSSHRLR
mmetsp:Transcript_18050/g.43459  ORF Transcript_18050/g.43459 Transcript_18050/m.43459 type:complete len:323 (-) Transcript_18050:1581-2549(-)